TAAEVQQIYAGAGAGKTVGNMIQGNFIGTAAEGSSALGNAGAGVLLDNSAARNLIGGTEPGAGNVIAFNSVFVVVGDFTGVAVTGTGSTENAIRANTIYGNGGLGIDLGDDGVTLNDSLGHVGPNNYANFPVLSAVFAGSTDTTIQGTLNSTPNTVFLLDFFANNDGDPSGYGEGQIYLGSASVGTDETGFISFNTLLPVGPSPGEFITVTATDAAGNTSEFAQNFTAPTVNVPVVAISGPTDSGAGAPVTFTSTV